MFKTHFSAFLLGPKIGANFGQNVKTLAQVAKFHQLFSNYVWRWLLMLFELVPNKIGTTKKLGPILAKSSNFFSKMEITFLKSSDGFDTTLIDG